MLNSPVLWWYSFRFLPHMKDEALATVVYKMDELPIPRPPEKTRSAVEATVGRLITIAREIPNDHTF